jgi:hypothetical protein
MTRVFLDPGLQRAFDRDGFAVTRLLSADEAAETLERVMALRDRSGFASNTPGPAPTYHVSLLDPDLDYRRAARSVAERALAERCGRILDGYRFLTGGFLLKPPGAAELDMHRDWSMTSNADDVALNCWCALGDVDERNGCLKVVPGSYALVPNIEAPGQRPFFAGYREALKDHAVTVPLQAGEAVIFDNRTLHGSGANPTPELRAAVSAAFIPRSARAVVYLPDTDAGNQRYRVVEPESPDWIDTIVEGRAGSAAGAKTIGFVRNDNRAVSLDEFERLLAARQSRHVASNGDRPLSLLGRLKGWRG